MMKFKKRLTNVITGLLVATLIGSFWYLYLEQNIRMMDSAYYNYQADWFDSGWIGGFLLTHVITFLFPATLSFLMGEGFKFWHKE